MHFHASTADIPLTEPRLYANHSQGYTQASLIDRATGSVHTGLSLNVLAPSGSIGPTCTRTRRVFTSSKEKPC